MQKEKLCICGCNTSIGLKSEFAPGHDGRVTGYFLQFHRGEFSPNDFGSMVAQIWKEWNNLDQPGGELYPKLKKAAQLARQLIKNPKDL